MEVKMYSTPHRSRCGGPNGDRSNKRAAGHPPDQTAARLHGREEQEQEQKEEEETAFADIFALYAAAAARKNTRACAGGIVTTGNETQRT